MPILVAADDPEFRSSLAFALEAQDYRVVSAAALDAAALAALAQGTTCIVLDHRPPALDGLGMLEALRARGIAKPVIVIASALPARAKRRIGAASGEWIEKPLLGDTLTAAVRRHTAPCRQTE